MSRHAPIYGAGLEALSMKDLDTVSHIHEERLRQIRAIQQCKGSPADSPLGADRTVQAAKRSMVDELEAMLDVVDPQPPGKSFFMRRRKFNMTDGTMNKELTAGVAQVIKMFNQEAETIKE